MILLTVNETNEMFRILMQYIEAKIALLEFEADLAKEDKEIEVNDNQCGD